MGHFRDVPSKARSCEPPLLYVFSCAFRNDVGLLDICIFVGWAYHDVEVCMAACGCHASFFFKTERESVMMVI